MIKVTANLAFAAYGRKYHLVRVSSVDDQANLGAGKLMVFQVDGTSAKLIWEAGADAGTYLSGDEVLGIDWPLPGDWEQNGKLDFGVFYYVSNSCSPNFSSLEVYVLNPD